MTRIILKTPGSTIRYPHDCARIVRILYDRGYVATKQEAHYMWEQASDASCAGWLILDDDDDAVYQRIRPYFYNDDEDDE